MTLNLALEDVPWAILELVKARILRNRMKLLDQMEQQEPPQTLKPLNQYPSIGARSSWRRDEPAATLDPVDGVSQLIIWYPSTLPALGRVSPGNASVPGVFQEFSFSPGYITEEDNGSNVWVVTPTTTSSRNILHEFTVDNFAVGTGDFTLEFYARIQEVDAADGTTFGLVSAFIAPNAEGFNSSDALSLAQQRQVAPPAAENYQLIAAESSGDSSRENLLELPSSEVSPDAYFHCSYQRIGGVPHAHFRGEPVSLTSNDWTAGTVNYGSQQLKIAVALDNGNNGSAFAGQVRLTTRALYGTGTYTPPTEPFYDPAP